MKTVNDILGNLVHGDIAKIAKVCKVDYSYVYKIMHGAREAESEKAQCILREARKWAKRNVHLDLIKN